MESQNHYYGHSGAFAHHVGLRRPRHVAGLVQHGWTTTSPVTTHFRDFPSIGAPGGRTGRSLFVWSHSSRAWDPSAETRRTVPIGAPWLYLCEAAGEPAGGTGTVILPVHGIPTQQLHGDHATTARQWSDLEGPSTVCLYHVEADDPAIVAAYRDAGHRCVTLGHRNDPAFLGRLHGLLASAGRVVSNRLSTPVVYAAAAGIPTAVHGDPMELSGEDPAARARTLALWPEFHDPSATSDARRGAARDELGSAYVREPAELRALLGWDRAVRPGPWVEHWAVAPASRAVTTLSRRRAGSGSTTASAPTSGGTTAWLRGALSYLPRPLGAVVTAEVAGPPLVVAS